jgi:transposase
MVSLPADRRSAMPSAAKERDLMNRLWERVRPLLPEAPSRPDGGRPRNDDRKSFEGIVYQLRNGIRWRDMPKEYGSGATCWRRHQEWTAAGVWEEVWQAAVEELDAAGGLDVSELFADATFVPAQKGGPRSGKRRSARG